MMEARMAYSLRRVRTRLPRGYQAYGILRGAAGGSASAPAGELFQRTYVSFRMHLRITD